MVTLIENNGPGVNKVTTKRVTISFDAEVPSEYTERQLEEVIGDALATKGVIIDSYVEIHTL